MKRFLSLLLCGVALAAWVQVAKADHDQPKRLDEVLLRPDVVFHHVQDLGLDETQQQAIREEMQKASEKMGVLQAELQKQVGVLSDLLSSGADEQKALAQLDKVLDAERLIKHAHFSLSLAIRGKLTATQQAKAREYQEKSVAEARTQAGPGGPPDAIRQKMQRIGKYMDGAHRDGRDMSDVQPLMQELMPLVHQGKYKEAEPIMDKVLKILDEPAKK